MTNRQRLGAIERLLTDAMATLDAGAEECGCCARVTYTRYDDHLVEQRLLGMRKKIRRLRQETHTHGQEWLERR